jgi:hypothetical protein
MLFRLRHLLTTIAFVAITTLGGGCYLHSASLTDIVDTDSITLLNPSNAPIVKNPDGSQSISVTMAAESSDDHVTLDYDSVLWFFTRLLFLTPSQANGSRDLLLLDTGLHESARVSLDVVARRNIPAQLGKSRFAYLEDLVLDGITFKNMIAPIEDTQWQYRVLGMPIYRLSGFALGAPALRQCRYLAFDNPNKQVTFGIGSAFKPSSTESFHAYKMQIQDGSPTVN